MSYFKAEMHQIQFPLGLGPRPSWGSLQRSPDLLAVFILRGPTSKWREGEEKGKKRRGKEGRGERKERGREGEEKGRKGGERPYSPVNFWLRHCQSVCLLTSVYLSIHTVVSGKSNPLYVFL